MRKETIITLFVFLMLIIIGITSLFLFRSVNDLADKSKNQSTNIDNQVINIYQEINDNVK